MHSYYNSGFVIPLFCVCGLFSHRRPLPSLCQGGGHVAKPRVIALVGSLALL